MKRGKAVIALLLCLGLLGSSSADVLGRFEDAVAKPASSSNASRTHHYSNGSNDDSDEELVAGIVVGVVAGIAYGVYRGVKWVVYDWWAEPDSELVMPASSTNDVDHADYSFTDAELGGPKHKLGTPGLPYVRFDYRWQYLESDLDANDFLLEAGFEYLALYGRVTQYRGAADEKLDIEQYYGMVRYGGTDEFYFPGSFQIGAGVGWFSIKGDQIQEGPALTVPVMLYPNDWVGFEFRPAWTVINEKTVSDYDLSVNLGHEFTHMSLGYRWLWVQHEGPWLKGPYAGVFVTF